MAARRKNNDDGLLWWILAAVGIAALMARNKQQQPPQMPPADPGEEVQQPATSVPSTATPTYQVKISKNELEQQGGDSTMKKEWTIYDVANFQLNE